MKTKSIFLAGWMGCLAALPSMGVAQEVMTANFRPVGVKAAAKPLFNDLSREGTSLDRQVSAMSFGAPTPYRSDIAVKRMDAVRTAAPVRITLKGMQEDQPELYRQYMRSQRQEKWGFGLLIGGGVCLVGGYVGVVLSTYKTYLNIFNNKNEEDEGFTVSGLFMVAGVACIATGTPLLVVGSVNKGRASRAYKRTLAGQTPNAHFQINAHRDGLGLAYVF